METRHKHTKEVKAILSGEGFNATVPKYMSRPDLANVNKSHQVLSGYQPASLEASRVVEVKEPEGNEHPYEKRRAFANEALDVDLVIDPDRQNRIYGKP